MKSLVSKNLTDILGRESRSQLSGNLHALVSGCFVKRAVDNLHVLHLANSQHFSETVSVLYELRPQQ